MHVSVSPKSLVIQGFGLLPYVELKSTSNRVRIAAVVLVLYENYLQVRRR